MILNRRNFLAAAAGAAGAASLPGAARAQLMPQYQQPLTIMVNAPLSGSGMAAGLEIVHGVQAAIDETNRMNPTLSTAFAIRTVDDQGALAQSMVNVQFAASDATVLAVVGGFDGQLLAGSEQSYADEQMALIVPGSTADVVTARGYRNVFRLPAKDSTEGALAAKFIIDREHPKQPIAITQDGDYGPDVATGFLDQMRASKMANALEYTFTADKPDFAAAAASLMSKRPDYLYFCGTSDAMGPLVPALRAAGYNGRMGASQGFYNNDTLTRYASDFEGGILSTPMPPLERAPDFAMQLNDFRARYAVTSLSAFGYAAAQIIMLAARRSGATSRLALLTALETPATYNTIVGPFQFSYTGDPIDPLVYFYTVTNGKFKFIAPSHVTGFVL